MEVCGPCSAPATERLRADLRPEAALEERGRRIRTRRFSRTPRSHRSRISPTENEPSICPRSRSSSVLPLRPQPPMYRTLNRITGRGEQRVGHRGEPLDGVLHHVVGRSGDEVGRAVQRISKERAELPLVGSHLDVALFLQPPCEPNLVIVDVLPQGVTSGNHDRLGPRAHAVDDGARTTVTDDRLGRGDPADPSRRAAGTPRPRPGGGLRGAVLDEGSGAVGSVREPGIDPADQPIERVMIGADRDE